jgi:hypothetical protein
MSPASMRDRFMSGIFLIPRPFCCLAEQSREECLVQDIILVVTTQVVLDSSRQAQGFGEV